MGLSKQERRSLIAARVVGARNDGVSQTASAREVANALVDNVARLIFLGTSVPEIAEELQIDATTVGQCIATDEYRERIQSLRLQADAAAIDAKALLNGAQAEAVLHAKDIMRRGTNRDRLTAAFGILDRGGNPPRGAAPSGMRLELSEAIAERLMQTLAELPRRADITVTDQ